MAQIEFTRSRQKDAAETIVLEILELLEEDTQIIKQKVLDAISTYDGAVKPTLDQVTTALFAEGIKVMEEVSTVSVAVEAITEGENPLATAATEILAILENNIESDMPAKDWLNKSAGSIISVLTRGRKGKAPLSAQKVWKEIVKQNAQFSEQGDLMTAFIEKFSNLKTN